MGMAKLVFAGSLAWITRLPSAENRTFAASCREVRLSWGGWYLSPVYVYYAALVRHSNKLHCSAEALFACPVRDAADNVTSRCSRAARAGRAWRKPLRARLNFTVIP